MRRLSSKQVLLFLAVAIPWVGTSAYAHFPQTSATRFVAESDSSDAATSAYEYDALGRLTQVTFSDGSGWQYTYDASGNLVRSVSRANNPPGAFLRLLPEDSTYVHADSLTFTWSASTDPQDQAVFYTLRIELTGSDTTLVTEDTTAIFVVEPRAEGDEDREIRWSVKASDGFLSTQAADGEGYFVLGRSSGVGAENLLDVPTFFALYPAYPSPFNPTTTIAFDVAAPVHVKLTAYDVLGRLIAVILDAPYEAGRHKATFDARNLPSGLYFYAIRMGNFAQTRSVVLVK